MRLKVNTFLLRVMLSYTRFIKNTHFEGYRTRSGIFRVFTLLFSVLLHSKSYCTFCPYLVSVCLILFSSVNSGIFRVQHPIILLYTKIWQYICFSCQISKSFVFPSCSLWALRISGSYALVTLVSECKWAALEHWIWDACVSIRLSLDHLLFHTDPQAR